MKMVLSVNRNCLYSQECDDFRRSSRLINYQHETLIQRIRNIQKVKFDAIAIHALQSEASEYKYQLNFHIETLRKYELNPGIRYVLEHSRKKRYREVVETYRKYKKQVHQFNRLNNNLNRLVLKKTSELPHIPMDKEIISYGPLSEGVLVLSTSWNEHKQIGPDFAKRFQRTFSSGNLKVLNANQKSALRRNLKKSSSNKDLSNIYSQINRQKRSSESKKLNLSPASSQSNFLNPEYYGIEGRELQDLHMYQNPLNIRLIKQIRNTEIDSPNHTQPESQTCKLQSGETVSSEEPEVLKQNESLWSRMISYLWSS